jgi:hypothetical protein
MFNMSFMACCATITQRFKISASSPKASQTLSPSVELVRFDFAPS